MQLKANRSTPSLPHKFEVDLCYPVIVHLHPLRFLSVNACAGGKGEVAKAFRMNVGVTLMKENRRKIDMDPGA